MSLDPQDARLTAHALGELPPRQAEAVEAELWESPDAHEAVQDTRAVAEMLVFGFAAEEPPALTARQRREIIAAGPASTLTPEKECRLTALALGELRPAQTEALTAWVDENRAGRVTVEEVQVLGTALREAFAAEPRHALTDSQRAEIYASRPVASEAPKFAVIAGGAGLDGAGNRRVVATPGFRLRPWLRSTAAAAAGLVLFGVAHRSHGPGDPDPVVTGGTNREGVYPVHRSTSAADAPFRVPDPQAALQALVDQDRRRSVPVVNSQSVARLLRPDDAEPPRRDPPEAAPPVIASQPAAAKIPPFELGPAAPATIPARPDPARVAISRQRFSPGATPSLTAVAPKRVTAPPPNLFLDAHQTPQIGLPADTGRESFDIARRCVRDFGLLPPAGLVRIEELVNQLDYAALPSPGADFGIAVEGAVCPWNPQHQLVRVTVAARETPVSVLPPVRLSFLVRIADTPENERARLLLWQGIQALLPRLRSEDSVALVACGAKDGVVLEPVPGWSHDAIRSGLERLHQGGPPTTETGLNLAFTIARSHFAAGGINRIIIVTDGPLDTSASGATANALARDGIALSLSQLGPRQSETAWRYFSTVPILHADSSPEAARIFSREFFAPTAPMAEQVDIQVAFDPSLVHSYRPLGFDSSRAAVATTPVSGSWQAGRQVTALYEIVPLGGAVSFANAPTDRFERESLRALVSRGSQTDQAVTVKVRYQTPADHTWHNMEYALATAATDWREASPDLRLAAAAAGYGLILKSDTTGPRPGFSLLGQLLAPALNHDPYGLRREFANLVEDSERLRNR